MQIRLLIAFLILSSNLFYTQEVISSNGEDGVGPTFHYTYTVGEPVIETGLAGNNYLTQGFNQPNDECYVNTQFDVTSCNTYLWNGSNYAFQGIIASPANSLNFIGSCKMSQSGSVIVFNDLTGYIYCATWNNITNNFNLLSNETIVQISVGDEHSVAVSSQNRIFTWGRNEYGVLGIEELTQSYFPFNL